MAPDLLSTIRHEIDERLNELRPLLAEHERLLVAAEALVAADRQDTAVAAKEPTAKDGRRGRRAAAGRRGSAAGAIKLAAAASSENGAEGNDEIPEARPQEVSMKPAKGSQRSTAKGSRSTAKESQPSPAKPKPERAARGAAREAILGALEHGSHTVGELAVVTAMSGPNINGNLRRLAVEGVVVKAVREGKAAWALADTTG
jgi:hypothetical protein